MAINLTSTEALLLITDLILIIMVVYLLDRLRKIKKNVGSAEKTQSPETAVPLEVKPDLSIVKIDKPEKAEPKTQSETAVTASAVSSESTLNKDELEDRLLEELHAIPSGVKSDTETKEPGTLKLEDELPGENQDDIETGDAKPEKARKSRKKKSKSKKTSGAGEAAQTLSGETKVASGKKLGRRKKAAEQTGQMVETKVEAKPAQEIAKEENAEAVVKVEKAEEIVKEEKPEVPVEEKKQEELKEPQKDSLF